MYENIEHDNICAAFVNQIDCVDTPSWANGYGETCNSYAIKFCENGAAKSGNEWALNGTAYNYPAENCCVCGKTNDGKDNRNIVQYTYSDSSILVYQCYNIIKSHIF